MIDWDDVRFFLAVARRGSVRAAAEHLKVNHSTVLRRIAQLEQRLVALLSTYLLMPALAEFARLHPEVEMGILTSYQRVNLTNREADVAIRVVYDPATLPQNLHALKGPQLFGAVYMSRALFADWRAGSHSPIRWIVRNDEGIPDWARTNDVPVDGTTLKTTDAETQILAVREGLGMTILSCFVGDADPLLVRVPGSALRLHGCVWLLTQGETRKTKRVRLFTTFMFQRLATYQSLLAGQRARRD